MSVNEKDREEAKAFCETAKVIQEVTINGVRQPDETKYPFNTPENIDNMTKFVARIRSEAVKAEREMCIPFMDHKKDCALVVNHPIVTGCTCGLESILSDDKEPAVCEWTYDSSTCSWDTSCGEKWQFTADGPKENGVKYCHACGKPVKEASRG